jgi:hypothetical protein
LEWLLAHLTTNPNHPLTPTPDFPKQSGDLLLKQSFIFFFKDLKINKWSAFNNFVQIFNIYHFHSNCVYPAGLFLASTHVSAWCK